MSILSHDSEHDPDSDPPQTRSVKNANITPTVELNALAMKRGEVRLVMPCSLLLPLMQPTTYTFLEPASVRQAGPQGQYRGGHFTQVQTGTTHRYSTAQHFSQVHNCTLNNT